MEVLNSIKNSKLIKISNCVFCFVEDTSLVEKSCVSEYYFKITDFSINVYISLKWSLWGYYFLSNIREEVLRGLYFDKSLIPLNFLSNEYNESLIFDDVVLEDFDKFRYLLENEYSNIYYDANTKVRLKLKLNPKDFLILNHVLFPTFLNLP